MGALQSPERVLGSLFHQGIDELLSFESIQVLKKERARLLERHCAQCRFDKTCDQRAIFDVLEHMPPGPCWLESSLIEAAMDRVGQVECTTP